MDWNWLFSAVAQSSAAIVGIFGAFVFTKIINNQSEFQRKRSLSRQLMLRALRLVEESDHRYFDWYNERTTERELERLSDSLKESVELENPNVYFEARNFSPFVSRSTIIEKISAIVESEKSRRANPPAPGVFSNLVAPQHLLPLEISSSIENKVEAERDAIDRLIVSTRDHARQVFDFVTEARENTEYSPLISFSIGAGLALFYCGVIYPLSFLPLDSGQPPEVSLSGFWEILLSLKGGILAAISAIFSAIMVVFMVINRRLRFRPSELDELARYGDFSTYSPFFEVLEENLVPVDPDESGAGG